ncbi:MAG: anti-sigma factor antagonist [Thermoflexaceae bacterium]|nr:anti-sigma factor antagonist [Thermoflexaceae bacterium]
MKNVIMLEGDRMIIRVGEELDHHITKELRENIDTMIDKGIVKNIAFDFSTTGFMDSAGIGLIMGRYKKIEPLGGSISIVGTNPAIERIIRISGIHKIIRMELAK